MKTTARSGQRTITHHVTLLVAGGSALVIGILLLNMATNSDTDKLHNALPSNKLMYSAVKAAPFRHSMEKEIPEALEPLRTHVPKWNLWVEDIMRDLNPDISSMEAIDVFTPVIYPSKEHFRRVRISGDKTLLHRETTTLKSLASHYCTEAQTSGLACEIETKYWSNGDTVYRVWLEEKI